jgi:sugar transferase (PEP-CTERM/EpsH1 system associated)
MADILFLAHRIPYPPDKGEKIRAWNVLRHLASRHRVHLGTFIDDPADSAGVEPLKAICASVFWRPLSRRRAKLRSLPGLLTGASLTQGYFADLGFSGMLDRVVEWHQPDLCYVFSSAMAPYAARCHGAPMILDMVDVDSEKWRQYAATSSGPARRLYAREGRTLLALERRAAKAADSVILASRAETELFAGLAPEAAPRIHAISNGVDTERFSPLPADPNPFGDRPAIVFTGMMDYRPNVDAMTWFVAEVMPRLRVGGHSPCLWIVGANPVRAVRALASPDVCVTGRVPDVRPYLRHARAVVAPLQIARGVPNKVLEAMAMGTAVVVTPQAREGLDRVRDDELLTAATPAAFADAVGCVLDGNAGAIGARARARAVRDYGWPASLAMIDRLIDAALGAGALPNDTRHAVNPAPARLLADST